VGDVPSRQLVHEGKLPREVRLAWVDGASGHIKAGDPKTNAPFEVTADWVGILLRVVENAPENLDLFPRA
jgi:hypothetical protein